MADPIETGRCEICGEWLSAHTSSTVRAECDEVRRQWAWEAADVLAPDQHHKDAGNEEIPF